MRKGYYELALDNLKYLEKSLDSECYNPMSVQCQQIAEKMLKSVLELVTVDCVEPLKSHNLVTINSYILKSGVNLHLNAGDLALLKDMYYTTRYPGQDYIDVSVEQMADNLRIMYGVIASVNLYRFDNQLPYTKITPKYLKNNTNAQVQEIFDKYRAKFNIKDDVAWCAEYTRLCTVCGVTTSEELAKHIQENFL